MLDEYEVFNKKMNNKIKTLAVREDETILNCLKIINSTHSQFVYIINKKGKLQGILTDADIRRALLKKKKLNENIKNIYNKKPKYIFENDDLIKIRKVFRSTKVNFLLVVNKFFKVINYIDFHSFSQNEIKNFQIRL